MKKFLVKDLEVKLAEGGGSEFIQTAGELIAEDFVEFGSSGIIYDRQQTINSYSGSASKKIDIRDYTEKQLGGDAILVNYLAVISNEKGEEIKSLRTSVWKKMEGSWKIIFHQGTLKGGAK